MIIHKADGVTFPRSGHHYLVQMLSHYFDGEFLHHEPYCGLGSYAESHISKTHDFNLKHRVGEGRKTLVQIRGPMPAIISHYEMHVKALLNGGAAWRNQVTTRCECDCEPAWRVFLSRQIDYYVKFYLKWIARWIPDRLVLQYEDLRIDRKDALMSVVAFLGVPPDADRAQMSVDFVGELPMRQVSAFQYYDQTVFDKARADIIKKIACPPPEHSYDI